MVNHKLKRALKSASDKQLEVIEHSLCKLYRDFDEEDAEALRLDSIAVADVLESLKVIVVVA